MSAVSVPGVQLLSQIVSGTLYRLAVFPFSTGGTDDGTLFVTVAARDPDSDIGADLDIRRLALAP